MLPRVWLPASLTEGALLPLEPEQAHHLLRVLRMADGDEVQVFDGRGHRHRAVLRAEQSKGIGKGQTLIEVGAALPANVAQGPRLNLVQAVSSAERMDWTIEKATELGVARITPVLSHLGRPGRQGRGRIDPDRARRKSEHWQRLLVAAAMQCGRDDLPELAEPTTLEHYLSQRPGTLPGVVLAPPTDGRPAVTLSAWLERSSPLQSLDLLVGPESGLDDLEIEAAERAGFAAVSLGPRILRTETAGMAALAIVQSRIGDL